MDRFGSSARVGGRLEQLAEEDWFVDTKNTPGHSMPHVLGHDDDEVKLTLRFGVVVEAR